MNKINKIKIQRLPTACIYTSKYILLKHPTINKRFHFTCTSQFFLQFFYNCKISLNYVQLCMHVYNSSLREKKPNSYQTLYTTELTCFKHICCLTSIRVGCSMLKMTSNKVSFLNQMIGECDSKQTNKMHCSVLKI